MLIDIRTLHDGSVITCDYCIVGAGAAGIALAREFIGQSYQVCVLESGGTDFDSATQQLAAGENLGVDYFPLQESRAHYLGGSTNLWGGWSRPLDPLDFEHRPWMSYSGWPFSKAELDPYYARAQTLCHLGPLAYNLEDWQEPLHALGCDRPKLGSEVIPLLWQIIPPDYLRFGVAYREELTNAPNITTYLHATVTDIETNDVISQVTKLHVGTLIGKTFTVEARVFVLAAGGIDNPRLLLVANRQQSSGLGNQNDLVGRFFMEHPYLPSGTVQLSHPPALLVRQNIPTGDLYLAGGLSLTPQVQRQEKLLNFGLRLLPLLPNWLEAFNKLRYALKDTSDPTHAAFPSISEICRYPSERITLAELALILRNTDKLLLRMWRKVFDRNFYSGQSTLFQTHLIGEQEPNWSSRVTLSHQRDALGMPLADLDWQLTTLDRFTLKRSQQLLANKFAANGLGHINQEWTMGEAIWEKLIASYHHMGTTRLGTSSQDSVVDPNCRLHNLSNLYVTGSSVFPTSGLSNPTLTIVALALRLADHLRSLH